MAEELYESLQDMFDSFYAESIDVKKRLEDNLNRISEIDAYMNKLSQKEETDFNVFSPRSIKVVYEDEIKQKEDEKHSIENDNQYYYKKINQLDSRIRTLSSVLNMNNSVPQNKDTVLDNTDIEKNLQILNIQEKERQRIARDLHDSSLQNLAHIIHKIELASLYIDEDAIKAKLELAAVNKDLKMVIQDIRNTIFDLRPMSFDDLGLKESLERLTDKLKQSSTFHITTDMQDINSDNTLVLMTIFRIVEECLNNAIKHSSGNSILLSLKNEENNKCRIVVTDNGRGFDIDENLPVKDRHFGLCILKERVRLLAGTIIIDSKPDVGTAIDISIPL